MRRKLFYVIALVAVLGCNDKNKKDVETKVEKGYPPYIIKSFMNGCSEDSTHPDVTQTLICSCLMEKIQIKYTLDEYLKLSKEQSGANWDAYQMFLTKEAEICINNNTNK